MAGLKRILIATMLATSLSNVTPVSAVGAADFSGTATWGEAPDGSAAYVCVDGVFDGLNLIVSYPL